MDKAELVKFFTNELMTKDVFASTHGEEWVRKKMEELTLKELQEAYEEYETDDD